MEIRTIQPFLQYFGNVRERTMRVARCIPPDKLDWSYAPGKFTLGDLLRHIAVAERFMWAETAQGHTSRYTTHGKELADGYENVMAFMERLHAESMEVFAKLSDEDLEHKCKDARQRGNHEVEMAAPDGGARNPSPRPNLSLSGNARRAHSSALRAHVRRGARAQQRRVMNCPAWISLSRMLDWGPGPLQQRQPFGRGDPRPPDRAWRVTGTVHSPW